MHYRWHGENLSFGNNIFKLKTDKIVKQYLDDLNFAYKNQWINKTYADILKSKVKLYENNRNIKEKKAVTNKKLSRLDYYKILLRSEEHT
ncbi:hypothetical protein V6O07_16770, partial [Arthrospira platensis SPKY2]